MTIQAKNTVNLFDKYSLVIPQGLKWREVGPPGQRVLFITDKEGTFTASFEEGMNSIDTNPGEIKFINKNSIIRR